MAVTGTTAIAGTLNAVFASGNYTPTQYTLVSSTGVLSGVSLATMSPGLSTNYNSVLSYDAHDVFLILSNAVSNTFSDKTTANINTGTVTVTGNQTTGGPSVPTAPEVHLC